MAAVITPEHPADPEVTALIAELDAHLTPLYASESRHGFSVQKLIADAVAFFVIRDDGAPAGCGGIKLFGTEYGEIKRTTSPPTREPATSRSSVWRQASTSTPPSACTSGKASSVFHRLGRTETTPSAGATRSGSGLGKR